MKMKTIKTTRELVEALSGGWRHDRPIAELDTVDGTVKGVRIGDVHVRLDSYTFSVCREVTHEEAKRYRVRATAPGFPAVVSYHDDYSSMRAAAKAFGEGVEVDTNNDQQVDVLLDAKGEVVAESGEYPAPDLSTAEDLPF